MSWSDKDKIAAADAARAAEPPKQMTPFDIAANNAQIKIEALIGSGDRELEMQGQIMMACNNALSKALDGANFNDKVASLIGALNGLACIYASVLAAAPDHPEVQGRLKKRFDEVFEGAYRKGRADYANIYKR